MGWETRGLSGPRYFTTTRRAGKKRVRAYYGRGVFGELASALREVRALEREEEEALLREERKAWADIEGRLSSLARSADLLLAASLVLAGHHRHKGQWRRRRDGRG